MRFGCALSLKNIIFFYILIFPISIDSSSDNINILTSTAKTIKKKKRKKKFSSLTCEIAKEEYANKNQLSINFTDKATQENTIIKFVIALVELLITTKKKNNCFNLELKRSIKVYC